MSGTVTLAPETIEAIDHKVVEILGHPVDGPEFVDAAEIARRFKVDRGYVYAHADELGAIRLGSGPRSRLRFDPKRVAEVLAPKPFTPDPDPAPRPPRPRRIAEIDLLPVKGDE